jgi:hypothetical protein
MVNSRTFTRVLLFDYWVYAEYLLVFPRLRYACTDWVVRSNLHVPMVMRPGGAEPDGVRMSLLGKYAA